MHNQRNDIERNGQATQSNHGEAHAEASCGVSVTQPGHGRHANERTTVVPGTYPDKYPGKMGDAYFSRAGVASQLEGSFALLIPDSCFISFTGEKSCELRSW